MKRSLILIFMSVFWSIMVCSQPKIFYDSNSSTFTLRPVPKIEKAAGAANEPYWNYTWEFGDGNYADGKELNNIKYTFQENGTYKVRLSLTPFYSVDTTILLISTQIKSEKKGIRKKIPNTTDLSPDKWVGLFSSTSDRAVPGHTTRLIARFHTPIDLAGKDGFLLIAYNKEKEEGLKFSPFSLLKDEIDTYGHGKLAKVQDVINNIASSSAINYVENLQTQSSLLAIHYPNVRKDEEKRFFFSLRSVKELEDHTEKNRNLSVKFIWLPKQRSLFEEEKQVWEHKLIVLKVHDPNKIKVKPRKAYFRKNEPRELEYEVHFQNTARGSVKAVTIHLDWPKNLNPQSVKGELAIIGKDTVYPIRSFRDTLVRSCYYIDRNASDGKITIFFKNTQLHGTHDPSVPTKFSKGFIRYTAISNNTIVDKSTSRAAIIFDKVKPVETPNTNTRWRHRSFGIVGGANLFGSIGAYQLLRDNPLELFTGGLYINNLPIGKGWGWEGEITYSSEKYQSINSTDTELGLISNDGILSMGFVDMNGLIHRQMNENISLGIGGGVSLPILAESAQTIELLEGDPIEIGNAASTFGLFQSNKVNSTLDRLLNESLESQKYFGFTGVARLKIGWMREFSFAIEQKVRVNPLFTNQPHICSVNYTTSLLFLLRLGSWGK